MNNHNHHLAKLYFIKATYFFVAGFANILTIIKTQSFSVTMLGIFLYYTPIMIENYMKMTYNKVTVILRRIGYILPCGFLFLNLLLVILVVYFKGFGDMISEIWYVYIIIGVTVALIFISFLDIFFYGFNEEEIKARDAAIRYLKKNRKQNRDLLMKQEQELKEEARRFKIERSKRGGR
ncbi:hypothetical protein [Staphylococcus delphini]|uniref:Uncharacterized protein n=1 Tax=Staphylococcus delphini TaxID=53344 RepID=A0A2A4GXT7_9STAP|nr:hypothetical protein [Staphylococcus delphini]MBZ8174889.1 hypothetical protein [Staphylococcus delphini]PCF56082.1 hypothetical protein B5C08_03900 [Staphylococcus delphini]PCF62319.1 hypothetical protein B5C01_04830 [Staphylococcus delphini]PCF74669.1 hypothetical protein B4W72_03830 [Staphylococcus delphini]HEC2158576.1 hypothetical protein [Staphylococcus delphini]